MKRKKINWKCCWFHFSAPHISSIYEILKYTLDSALAPHYCKQQTRTRLNNKAADPELRNLCSRLSQQDTTYSNLPPPQGWRPAVVSAPPQECSVTWWFWVHSAFLRAWIWWDYEDRAINWAWGTLNTLFDNMICASTQVIPGPQTGCVLILHRKCILKMLIFFFFYCTVTLCSNLFYRSKTHM